jgi:hypothetical protein
VTPGSTTWTEAVPAILVAAALLYVPGTVAARLVRLPWSTAVGVGPAVGTTLLVGGGVASAAVGMPWGLLPVLLTTAAGWLVAGLLGLVLRRRGAGASGVSGTGVPGARGGSRDSGQGGDRDPSTDVDSSRAGRALMAQAWVGGLAFAFLAVAVVLARVTGTPDHFPQHPDTIFHLGDALWMTQQRDVSVLHAFHFMATGRSGTYPAAFHVITATTSLLSGANVVVATQSAVLVMGGLVWPAGLVLLGRALLGNRPEVVAATAVSSVLFTAFPFTIMGFGVLWPNLFGQALLPGLVATAFAALARWMPHRAPVGPAVPAALVTVVGLPGLTLAHPNALICFLVLGYLAVAVAVLRSAWDLRSRPLAAVARVGALLVVTAAAAVASLVVRSPSMVATGEPGPERGLRAAVIDTVFFGPRHGAQLPLLTVVAVLGGLVVLLRRHRGAGWLPVAASVFAGLYLLNVAVDDDTARYLTWPWYNNAIRLAVAGSLPSALCAAAGFVALGTLVARVARAVPTARAVATGLVLAAFLVVTHGYVYPHQAFLRGYYHPSVAKSWASDDELRALRELSTRIPDGAVTAANAWNGGTYLYVVSGKPLLVPTEKALFDGDRTLLAARLDQVGTDPEVCAAARRQDVQFALTGGKPFAWAGAKRVALYAGIDRVGSSPAFSKVATAGPYTLYRLTTCAG